MAGKALNSRMAEKKAGKYKNGRKVGTEVSGVNENVGEKGIKSQKEKGKPTRNETRRKGKRRKGRKAERTCKAKSM